MNCYVAHRVDKNDLAGQSARARRRSGQIKHVFFMLACSRQFAEVVGFDDDMTGRARHLALARSLQRLAASLGDIKQNSAIRCLYLLPAVAIGADEGDAYQAGAP